MLILSGSELTSSLASILPLNTLSQKLKDDNHFILNIEVKIDALNSIFSDGHTIIDKLQLNLFDGHRVWSSHLVPSRSDNMTAVFESVLPIPDNLVDFTLTAKLFLTSNNALQDEKILWSPPVRGHDPRNFIFNEDNQCCAFYWGTSIAPVAIPFKADKAWLNPEALYSAGVMSYETFFWIRQMLHAHQLRMLPDLSSSGWTGQYLFEENEGYHGALPEISDVSGVSTRTGLIKNNAILPRYGVLNFHYE